MAPRHISILLVEDNSHDAVYTERMLRMGGVAQKGELIRVDRLAVALEKLETESFDVVLLDMGLPDSVDLEGLDQVAAQAPMAAIIMLTGHENEEVGLECLRHGAQDFLSKNNLDVDSLRKVIRYALERKHAGGELCQVRNTAETGHGADSPLRANRSRDLCTPMNEIIGLVELLLKSPELSSQNRETVEGVLEHAESLRGVLNHMLDVQKMGDGKL